MDTDLSHEALERFSAIESRLDALEGVEPVTSDASDDEEEDQEEGV